MCSNITLDLGKERRERRHPEGNGACRSRLELQIYWLEMSFVGRIIFYRSKDPRSQAVWMIN